MVFCLGHVWAESLFLDRRLGVVGKKRSKKEMAIISLQEFADVSRKL